MWKQGLLFIAMGLLSSDAGFPSLPPLMEVSVVTGEGPLQLLGRIQYDRRHCETEISTQAALWADTARKSPLSLRARLGLGVGLQEKAQDLWNRRCHEEAYGLFEKAITSYGQTIELAAGDERFIGRTFRLQSRMNIARIYLETGEFDLAREILHQTLAERNSYLPAIVMLADLELHSGHPGEALAITGKIENQMVEDINDFSFGQFYAYRAEAHCQLGDAAQANWEIQKARQLDPRVSNAQCRIKKGD